MERYRLPVVPVHVIHDQTLFRTMNKRFISLLVLPVIMFAWAGCAGAQPLKATLTPTTVDELDASQGLVYYSLRTNQIIPDSLADTEAWDLAFQGTSITVNAQAQMVDVAFDSLVVAPEDGYRADDAEAGSAIPSGNGEGWYLYDSTTHVVSVMPERTIVLKTPEDTYAKVEILSYYEGQIPGVGAPRYYTFRYVHQLDGSRQF
jgi:hypothetical protein